jgi:hypothetical protein
MVISRYGYPLAILLATLLFVRPSFGQTAALRELRQVAGFNDADVRALDDGLPVVKVPSAEDQREVVVLGVVRIDVPATFLVDRLRNIEDALAGGSVAQQIGRFTEPPSTDDMAGFGLPRDDVKALRQCRPGRCDVKLPADVMDHVQAAVDWSAPDAEQQASRFMANWLTEYLEAYRRGGNAALATYDDKQEPLSVAEGFHMLLRVSARLDKYRPELRDYLERFPEANLSGAEDIYYWSVEDFGLKPVTHLYHTTIYRPAGESPSEAIIVRKQIYASHYFQAAVSFVDIADVGAPGSPALYVTFLTRQRFDGKVGGLNRSVLERKLRTNVQAQLADLRARVHSAYTAAGRGGS